MKVLVQKFYSEPVFALAVVQAACVVVIAKVQTPWVQIAVAITAAVCVVGQRQLVRPEYE